MFRIKDSKLSNLNGAESAAEQYKKILRCTVRKTPSTGTNRATA